MHLQEATPSAMNPTVLRRAQGKAKRRLFETWRQARDNDLVISTRAAIDAGLDVSDIDEVPGAKPGVRARSSTNDTNDSLKVHLRQVIAAATAISRVHFTLSVPVHRGRWRVAARTATKNNPAVLEVEQDAVLFNEWERKAAGEYHVQDAIQRRSMGVFNRVVYASSPVGKRKLAQARESVITTACQKHQKRERSITQESHYYQGDGYNETQVIQHLARTRRFKRSHVLVPSPNKWPLILVDKNIVLYKKTIR
jgi:hypothetical protein